MRSKVKIYTKTGDLGQTSLYGGKRVSKGNPQVDAYGTIDELNAVLGILITLVSEESDIKNILTKVQSDLFAIGAHLAGDNISLKFTKKRVAEMEKLIDKLDIILPELKNFILPGGSNKAAFTHFVRTLCRRAERKIVAFKGNSHFPDENIIIYLNRFSDLLFDIARTLNFRSNIKEIVWKSST